MNKPTIFFSHSSQDKKQLIQLKELFVNKTADCIQVFLSSDGESIPLGRNWVHQIEEALATTSIMFVFVTPASLKSSWLYFESGYAYSRNKKVVPIGFLGVDLASVPAPLNLLQGFNITSESGLNNIIAVANREFQHNHGENFNAEEYRQICSSGVLRQDTRLGRYAASLDHITFWVPRPRLLEPDPLTALKNVAAALGHQKREYEISDNTLQTQGVTFLFDLKPIADLLIISVDPGIADIALPLVENVLRGMLKDGLLSVDLEIRFNKGVVSPYEHHKLTGRLYGTEVKLAPDGWLRYHDLEFTFDLAGKRTILQTRLFTNQIDLQQYEQLLDLLFEREILAFSAIGS